MNKKTVILAGSGHAHLEVLKNLTKKEFLAHQFFLISPSRNTYYSGLIPRFISNNIDVSKLTIASASYAESKGVTFIQDSVQSVDSINNIVHLVSGKKIGFDLLSLNVGGTAQQIPTRSPQNTIHLRPFDEFLKKWAEVDKMGLESQHLKFVVVGGGAAAVEVSTALRFKQKNSEIHLVTQSQRLCESYSIRTSISIEKSLIDLNIQIHFNESVKEIESQCIRLKNGNPLCFDLIFIVTPTLPSEIIQTPVNIKLQNAPNLFSVGDGTSLLHHPKLPRSGVIAVHQGRHLAESIKNLLTNQPILDFKIPSRQLNLLITGHQSAHLIWGNISFKAHWIYQLKKWIDERYVRKFSS